MIIFSSCYCVQVGYFLFIMMSNYPSEQTPIKNSTQPKPWWESGKIKMQLAKIYHSKGMLEDFVDTIYTCVRETLVIELVNQKVILIFFPFWLVMGEEFFFFLCLSLSLLEDLPLLKERRERKGIGFYVNY